MRESASFRATFPPSATGFRSALWKYGVPGPDEAYEPLHPTLVAALESAASLPKKYGVTLLADEEEDPPQYKSWAELVRDGRRLAARLAARGVKKNEPVLLVFTTSFEFITSFFALMMLGAVPVPSYPPAMMEKLELALDRLAHIARAAEVRRCLTSALFFPILGDLVRVVPTLEDVIPVERLVERGGDEQLPEVRIDEKDLCFLQYTSGSTDRPKGVMLTHRNVCANIHVIGQRAHINRHDVMVSWLPLYHDMGLIGAVFGSLFFQIPLVLMSPLAFLQRPIRWLQAITDYKGTITAAPNFGYALCVKRIRESERKTLNLRSWRLAMNGAEPVHHRTLVEFQKTFGPYGFSENAPLPVYGLAESSLAVTFPDPGSPIRYEVVDRSALADGHVVARRGQGTLAVVSVGKPMPGHSVLVVDAEGRPVGDGEVGHVVARGPSIMRGYYRDPEITKRILKAGALWTGDLGFLKDGELYITGRAKDLIIHRGHNYYAEDIERVVERVKGVRPGGVVAFSLADDDEQREQVILLVETGISDTKEHPALTSRIAEVVSEQIGLGVHEIVLVPPGTIPRTSSGKRQRTLARRLFVTGELSKQNKTGKLKAAFIYVRSRIGLWSLATRRRH